jgi:inorganic pyrophosphatase
MKEIVRMINLYLEISPILDLYGKEIVNVVVETPRGSGNKYDIDVKSGVIHLDRPIFSSLRYPVDYGFIPQSLSEDGDPLDVILLIWYPSFPYCVVKAKVVGMMKMEDEDGIDNKIICVADRDPRWNFVSDVKAIPDHLLEEWSHFFIHIKDLEKDKWAKVTGFVSKKRAIAEIDKSLQRFKREKGIL